MLLSFKEWEDKISKGWSKHVTVPVGLAKDISPESKKAIDPEKNPNKHRGKVSIHMSPDYSPKYTRKAL